MGRSPFDDRFDIEDVKRILGYVEVTLVVVGAVLLIVPTGGSSAAGLLFALAAVAGASLPSTVDANQKLVEAAKAAGFDDAADGYALRADSVESSPGVDLALAELESTVPLTAVYDELGVREPQVDLLLDEMAESARTGLSADELAAYEDARQFIGSDPNAAESLRRFGDGALGNDELLDVVAACPTRPIGVAVGNSFSGDTLVALADGTRLPIAEVQVGDQVLAYNFDAGEMVARGVTATLPHTDWLLEAHLSDGSTLTVTEDHRFWSVSDDEWVELQDLDSTDILLTPDGATVTVDYLNWDAGVTAPAWDLTVDQVHNFFVAADNTAEPVLVHNANILGFGCGDKISSAAATAIGRLSDSGRLSQSVADALLAIDSRSTREGIAEAIGRAGDDLDLAERIATNAVEDLAATRTVTAFLPDAGDVVLSGSRYTTLVARNPDVVRSIARSIRRGDLSVDEQRELARIVFDTDRGDVAVDYGRAATHVTGCLVCSFMRARSSWRC